MKQGNFSRYVSAGFAGLRTHDRRYIRSFLP